MAPSISHFSAIFIIEGGMLGIYDEYLSIKNDRAIVKKDYEFYFVKVLDKRIYDYIKRLCKKDKFDFNEVPMPTDMPSIKIIINEPCKKEIEMYGIGFGKKPDRVLINEIYNISRNLKYKIIKDTLPSKIIIYYNKINFFEKGLYIDLSEYDFNESGKIEIVDSKEIKKIIETIKNYRSRFYYIKSKDNFYNARIEIRL